jgi:hypothetical protein
MSYLHNHACLIPICSLALMMDSVLPPQNEDLFHSWQETASSAQMPMSERKKSLAMIQLNMRKGRENNARLPFAYNEARKCSPLLSVRQKTPNFHLHAKGESLGKKHIEMTVPAV